MYFLPCGYLRDFVPDLPFCVKQYRENLYQHGLLNETAYYKDTKDISHCYVDSIRRSTGFRSCVGYWLAMVERDRNELMEAAEIFKSIVRDPTLIKIRLSVLGEGFPGRHFHLASGVSLPPASHNVLGSIVEEALARLTEIRDEFGIQGRVDDDSNTTQYPSP